MASQVRHTSCTQFENRFVIKKRTNDQGKKIKAESSWWVWKKWKDNKSKKTGTNAFP